MLCHLMARCRNIKNKIHAFFSQLQESVTCDLSALRLHLTLVDFLLAVYQAKICRLGHFQTWLDRFCRLETRSQSALSAGDCTLAGEKMSRQRTKGDLL